MIKKATIQNVKKIYKLLEIYGQQGILLPRPLSVLYENIRNFLVYKDKNNQVIGCCSLQICWEDLAEIRSLAVHPNHKNKKIGKMLIKAHIAEAEEFGIKKIFALTYVPEFFAKLGFKKIDKKKLPTKIWSDCIHCLKYPDCDEIAVMLEL